MARKCYMCSRKATSREHVPPKCIFPEKKDLPPGLDYRRNLITVPSCDEHNWSKSQDDEYILLVILAHSDNNEEALRHFRTKMMRNLSERPHLLSLYTDPQPVWVDGRLTIQFKLDLPRFLTAMDHIVRGLYYHEYRARWPERIHVHSPAIHPVDETGQYLDAFGFQDLNQFAATRFWGMPRIGENPQIFYYQIHHEEETNLLVVRMAFYEGFYVNTFSAPTLSKLPDSWANPKAK